MISISQKNIEPSQMNNANQSIPIPKNPELDGVFVGFTNPKVKSFGVFSQKLGIINSYSYMMAYFFSGAPTKTGEIPQTATKISSALSVVAP